MLLEFTIQVKEIVHQDAPLRCQLREELHCREIRSGAVYCQRLNSIAMHYVDVAADRKRRGIEQ